MIRLTRLQLRSYRGIKELDVPVKGSGVIAKGRNGAGKTTVLRAIGAALASADIGADAVKIGDKEGEILIDLDVAGKAMHVRRRFGSSGSTLAVTNDEGDKKSKPTQVLAELLGSAPLDVVGMVLEQDPKKRRALILHALPVRVTVEQLRRWVPSLPDTYNVEGHGLEVVERMRARAYDQRTEANKIAKEAAATAHQASLVASEAEAKVPAGAGDVEAAGRACEEAKEEMNTIAARRAAAERTAQSMSGFRMTADRNREQAQIERERAKAAPTAEAVTKAEQAYTAARVALEQAERAADVARAAAAARESELAELQHASQTAVEQLAKAAQHDRDAERLEASIAQATEVVSEEDFAAAKAAHTAAAAALDAAHARARATERRAAARAAEETAKTAQAEADRLDGIVKALSTEAPAAILAETEGVAAGLELDGDEVRLGGVSLDKLCGAERLRFAADVAKALNPGVGFLVCDGLERLDPEQLDAFVAAATVDGRQLFGSLVDRGELVLAHLNHDASAAAAE
jgi:hypothetical protein